MSAIIHIARNTFRECVRQPIYVIVLLTALAIIGTYPIFALFVFREQVKLVTDGSLATILVFGWLSAALCASHAISREIETGTALLVLSKPITRTHFILAKTVGTIAAAVVFVWVTGVGTLLAVRVAVDQFRINTTILSIFFSGIAIACILGGINNYIRRRSFPASTVGALVVISTINLIIVFFIPEHAGTNDAHLGYDLNLIKAIFLILLAVCAMAALATALSTRLSLVSNLTVCAVIFILGLISDYLYSRLIALKLSELAYMMHSWPLFLLPLLAATWMLAAHHFHSRKQTRHRRWSLHLSFAAFALVLLGRAALNTIFGITQTTPNWLMLSTARLLFAVKGILAETIHALLPNWQLFWMADALNDKTPIPNGYLALGMGYVCFLITALSILAIMSFASREVGSQLQR